MGLELWLGHRPRTSESVAYFLGLTPVVDWEFDVHVYKSNTALVGEGELVTKVDESSRTVSVVLKTENHS